MGYKWVLANVRITSINIWRKNNCCLLKDTHIPIYCNLQSRPVWNQNTRQVQFKCCACGRSSCPLEDFKVLWSVRWFTYLMILGPNWTLHSIVRRVWNNQGTPQLLFPQGNQVTVPTVGVTSQATIKASMGDNETFNTPNWVQLVRVIVIGHTWELFSKSFKILCHSMRHHSHARPRTPPNKPSQLATQWCWKSSHYTVMFQAFMRLSCASKKWLESCDVLRKFVLGKMTNVTIGLIACKYKS